MRLARVLGQVVSTVKEPGLATFTLLLVADVDVEGSAGTAGPGSGTVQVAVDMVGAGAGEVVLVTSGSAARVAAGNDAPVDHAVVAIADSVIHEGSVSYRKG